MQDFLVLMPFIARYILLKENLVPYQFILFVSVALVLVINIK